MKEANQKERKGKQEKERKTQKPKKNHFGLKSHQKGDPTETQNQE